VPRHLEIRVADAVSAADPDEGRRLLEAALSGAGLADVDSLALVCGAPEEAVWPLAGALAALPGVRGVSLVAARAHDPARTRDLLELQRACARRSLRLSIDFVLDCGADAWAALGRKPTSLAPVLESSRRLRLGGVRVRWWIPLVPGLAYRLEGLFTLADDERIEPVLVPAGTARAAPGPPPDLLDVEARRFMADFIAYGLFEQRRSHLSPESRAYYRALLDDLESGRDPAGGMSPVAVLAADAGHAWTLRQEQRAPDPAMSSVSGIRVAASSGPSGDADGGAGRAEVAEVLAEGARALGQWSRALVGGSAAAARAGDARLPRALLIGAYGGEHIGDAAILGGVLLRMHRRHGTTRAILVSQRPDHTRRLVAMLDVPVEVTVQEYRQSALPSQVTEVDAVVFAGGPLMDLPRQLVKHLSAASLARRLGKPFFLEGIGVGPFVRRPSEWVGRRLIRLADRISVRTPDDGRARQVRGRNVTVGRDPAFDYLEARGGELTRLTGVDRQWVEQLVQGTEGRMVVGLNIRPIRPDYTTDTSAGRREEYTRFVERRFEERLAAAMRRLHEASTARRPCFIFFPMNAIQFGLSDLRSAHRLRRLLRGDVDFRLWEGDPGIDGVVALLRCLDVAITMRFHATIYALAQNVPVVGIDYRVGRRDKVAALLDGCGRSDSYRRIDEMTTDWLLERLRGIEA
jgi:polysaccharide pyruvyl transferase WcaK-like protein